MLLSSIAFLRFYVESYKKTKFEILQITGKKENHNIPFSNLSSKVNNLLFVINELYEHYHQHVTAGRSYKLQEKRKSTISIVILKYFLELF